MKMLQKQIFSSLNNNMSDNLKMEKETEKENTPSQTVTYMMDNGKMESRMVKQIIQILKEKLEKVYGRMEKELSGYKTTQTQ